jgi:hypothetical protein
MQLQTKRQHQVVLNDGLLTNLREFEEQNQSCNCPWTVAGFVGPILQLEIYSCALNSAIVNLHVQNSRGKFCDCKFTIAEFTVFSSSILQQFNWLSIYRILANGAIMEPTVLVKWFARALWRAPAGGGYANRMTDACRSGAAWAIRVRSGRKWSAGLARDGAQIVHTNKRDVAIHILYKYIYIYIFIYSPGDTT